MRKRKFLPIIILLISVLVLQGCSNSEAETEAPTAVPQPTVEPSAPVSAPTEAPSTQAPEPANTESAPPVVDTQVPAQAFDGETLILDRCTSCHSTSRITRESGSKEDWQQIVERMIRSGAVLSEEEKTFLIDYLAETYP
jgi:cytochrome c5